MVVGKALPLIEAGNDAQFAFSVATSLMDSIYTLSSAAHHQRPQNVPAAISTFVTALGRFEDDLNGAVSCQAAYLSKLGIADTLRS